MIKEVLLQLKEILKKLEEIGSSLEKIEKKLPNSTELLERLSELAGEPIREGHFSQSPPVYREVTRGRSHSSSELSDSPKALDISGSSSVDGVDPERWEFSDRALLAERAFADDGGNSLETSGGREAVPAGEISEPDSEERLAEGDSTEQLEKTLSEEEGKDEYYLDSQLLQFLNKMGVEIKTVPEQFLEEDRVLDSIALLIGKKYPSISEVYKRLKRTLNVGEAVSLSLENYPPEKISDITNIFTRLHDIAFLSEYNYKKSPLFLLRFRVSRAPKAINFFTGQWFERYLKEVVAEVIEKIEVQLGDKLSYAFLKNIQVRLPNNKDFEFDLIWRIRDSIFWIEGKTTSDYYSAIQKYSEISKQLKFPPKNSFLVLTDITSERARELSAIYSLNVVRIDEFPEQFEQAVRRTLNLSEEQ